jgi:hypothetical protein
VGEGVQVDVQGVGSTGEQTIVDGRHQILGKDAECVGEVEQAWHGHDAGADLVRCQRLHRDVQAGQPDEFVAGLAMFQPEAPQLDAQ